MDLSGRWHALVADDDLRRTWLDDDAGDEAWEPIDVPGHWRATPAFADSDGPLLHRTRFDHPAPGPGERAWLVLDGCFYQGDVWLDGTYVGDTEGYFFPHAFEVTEALGARTDHCLGVELTCARPSDLTAQRNITGSFQHGPWLDPAWNPGGIWRPVRVERSGPVRIRHLRVLCTDAGAERAVVSVRAVLDAAEGGPVHVRTTVAGTEVVTTQTLAVGENQIGWTVTVADPDLWWPHALGAQPLHEVLVEVHVPPVGEGGGEEPPPDLGSAAPSDRRACRIGLRSVSLRDWVMSVNGERLFLKGSNIGPTRPDLATTDPDEVRGDVALAREAGLDLLRVHSHIARPELYDAADEAGVLLWQDLPLHRGFARTVRKQAVRQAREAVDLLGHHPSVAIWCGHDEPVAPADPRPTGEPRPAGPSRSRLRALAGQQLPTWNKTVLDRSIRRALLRQDGSRPVIPHSGVLPHPPALDGTDSHLSFGWLHGDERQLPAFARLLPRAVRFVSQMGAQAVPESDDFVEAASWPHLDWDRLVEHHGMEVDGFEAHVPPAAHGTYVGWKAAGQRYQALVVSRHVLELRRLKYRPTGGFAQMGLVDASPRVSGSLLDHERVPKPAWDAFRAACRPVVVVADRLEPALAPGDAVALDVHVVSDRREAVEGLTATVRASWMGGGHTWRFRGDVPADACVRVGTLQLVVPRAAGPFALDLELTDRAGAVVATGHDRAVVVAPDD